MVFVYLSAEGRVRVCVYVYMYVCTYARRFSRFASGYWSKFFFRMNVLRFFFLWIIADSFMII